jgi:LemA protein
MQLQEDLTTTENKVSYARQFYNDSVMKYSTKKQTFPSNIVANLLKFPDKEYFEVEAAAREAPKVKF